MHQPRLVLGPRVPSRVKPGWPAQDNHLREGPACRLGLSRLPQRIAQPVVQVRIVLVLSAAGLRVEIRRLAPLASMLVLATQHCIPRSIKHVLSEQGTQKFGLGQLLAIFLWQGRRLYALSANTRENSTRLFIP